MTTLAVHVRAPLRRDDLPGLFARITWFFERMQFDVAAAKIYTTQHGWALDTFQVLSRTRIYDHVWDENFDGLSNTLEVHVMSLRRQLEAHGRRLIRTLRGRGYLFGEPSPPEGP